MISTTLKRLSVSVSLFALPVAAVAPPPAIAQTTEAGSTAATGYIVPETEVFDMTAKHGHTYRIYVSRPDGDAPEGGYPVLYVLDGNAVFAGFAEARRIHSLYNSGIDKMIVVGIGYPNTELYDGRRMGDFTPPIKSPQLKAIYGAYPNGGRDDFLTFLLNEARPEIARRYPVSENRQSLFGHSLGGLFALHVLYSMPGAFHAIIAASPSIWWDNQFILEEERAFAARLAKDASPGRKTRITVMVGGLEETPVTIADSIALGERLEALSGYGLRSDYEVLDGEGHLTVPARAVTKTLRAAMQWP